MRITNHGVVIAALLAAVTLAAPAHAGDGWRGRGGDWRGDDWRGGYADARGGWRGGAWGGDESCGRSYFYHDVFTGRSNSHISAFKDYYRHVGGPCLIQKVDIRSRRVLASYSWDAHCEGWRKLCDAEARALAYGGPGRYDPRYDEGPGVYEARW